MGLPSWRATLAGAVARIARRARIAKAKARVTAGIGDKRCDVCGVGLVSAVPGQVPSSVGEVESGTPSGGTFPCPACGRTSTGGR